VKHASQGALDLVVVRTACCHRKAGGASEGGPAPIAAVEVIDVDAGFGKKGG